MESAILASAAPASTLAMALIVSSPAPVVMLNGELEIIVASASFYRNFNLSHPTLGGIKFAELGQGEWNVPQLIRLLHAVAAGRPEISAYAMDLIRPDQPICHLELSAHKIDCDADPGAIRIVLAITDVTAIRLADKQKDDLLVAKNLQMQELQHRVANSLQIIASVLSQSARNVDSEETRSHLNDAHHRIMSIATLQKQLTRTQESDVSLRSYFTDLCESIAASMVADRIQLALVANVDDSKADARVSVSLGLIVTELVINSLKHAFANSEPAGTISVNYRSDGAIWALLVEDNCIGFNPDPVAAKPGLVTGIVEALAQQLAAEVTIIHTHPGTTVTVSNA